MAVPVDAQLKKTSFQWLSLTSCDPDFENPWSTVAEECEYQPQGSYKVMAAGNPAKSIQDELTCSICLDYFKDPVSLDCDHNFCRACITQCWEGFTTEISCPQCREIFPQRNLRLNRQLRNIVEAARELRLSSGREPEPERLCEKHKESLKLFCKEDEIPICLVSGPNPLAVLLSAPLSRTSPLAVLLATHQHVFSPRSLTQLSVISALTGEIQCWCSTSPK
uniref:RING-type domain-containing protein n=1 Tax=Chelonoidis abingdonii TaxID=106734 RepID=A0A8C0H012_CHEAB